MTEKLDSPQEEGNKDLTPLNGGAGSFVPHVPFDSESDSEHAQTPMIVKSTIDIPWKYRVPAFCMILLFGTGASFTDVVLGPLKSTLLKELQINNAQFSTVNTAVNIANTIMPIVGGLSMDYFGTVRTALFFSFFSVTGSIMAATSANTGKIGLLIGGRVLLGLGSVVLETSQYKLYTHWFSGSTLAFVIAIDLAWISVTSVCARTAAVPMSLINGWYGWALWIPCLVTILSFMSVSGYALLERSMPEEYRPKNGADIRARKDNKPYAFPVQNMLRLPMYFWIFAGTELFQNSARTVYSANLADIQEKTRGTSTLAAGYNAALQNVVSIIMAPILGAFFDRFGWRMPFISISAALYMIVFALIGLTTINPTGPIVLSSIALASNVMPIQASLPIMIHDQNLMGTAFGTWSAFIACNNVILEIATGAIQDKTPGRGYSRVIYFLIAIKAVQFCLGPIYDYLDGKLLGHSFRRSEKKRIAIREENFASGNLYRGWRVQRWATYVFGGQLVLMILTSWVLYLTYTVGGVAR